MSKFEDSQSSQSGREKWQNTISDWVRIFEGRPFKGDREPALHYPIRATGRYLVTPPEEVDQETGEITKPSYWERRTSIDGTFWWPVAAHRRAESGNYMAYGRDKQPPPNFQPVDDRAGKD